MNRHAFTTPFCPTNRLLWYRVIILSPHDSGTAKTAVSLSEEILNNSESSTTYFSASASIFLIASLEGGNLFWDKYKYKSLKYGLCMYPACIWLVDECLLIPFFGLFLVFCQCMFAWANICEWYFLYLYDLSGLWNVLDIMPSWNDEFSLKSKLISGLLFNLKTWFRYSDLECHNIKC